ncbi:MAG: YaaL family protein [Defluviitaleaceae bacterium]|nr:YaaL family protein [Defluviitaleaceae bacterium]
MTNVSQGIAYPIAPVEKRDKRSKAEAKNKGRIFGRKSKRLSREDLELVIALEAVKSDMEFLHNCFDHTTDAILVDSLVYELKSANLKYQYYLNQCKEKGIVHGYA